MQIDIIKEAKNNIVEKIRQQLPWVPEEIRDTDSIPKGDMPGDQVKIDHGHIRKTRIIFPKLLELLMPVLEENPYQRAVVVVCGGSGVGKSETASLNLLVSQPYGYRQLYPVRRQFSTPDT